MSNLVDLAALEVVTQRLKDADASSTVSLSTARQLCSELNYAVALLDDRDRLKAEVERLKVLLDSPVL